MPRLLRRDRFAAMVSVAVVLGHAPAHAQFVVEVRDASTGAGIDAKVQTKTGEASKYLGRTRGGQPLQSPEKCDGRLLSAAPVYPMYEAQDEDERWKPCSNKLTIFLRPLVLVSGGLQVPSSEQARIQFAAHPTVVAKIGVLENGAASGQLWRISASAKAVAEELETAGLPREAEKYWAVSAQSAMTVIAEDRGIKGEDDWLVAKGDRAVFTPRATSVIKAYQQANDLPTVGVLGPRTFESLGKKVGG